MPSRKEEDDGHNLQTEPLLMTTIDGQGRGGVQAHIHLPSRGDFALSGQALYRSTAGALLPNGPIYRCFVLENDEIKRKIQELLQKGHI